MAAQLRTIVPTRQRHVSYGSYFTQNDRFDGEYTALLNSYSVPPAGAGDQPAVVRALAASARTSNIPTCFLQAGQGKIRVLLQLDRAEPQMGLPDSQWVGRNIVLLGDLIENQAVMIELHDSAWNMGTVTRVAEHGLVNTTLAGDLTLETMGPFDVDDAGTELVRNRKICAAPPPLVEGLLAIQNLTPRKAYTYVYGRCVAEGWLLSCKPLLDYLRCAMTVSAGGNDPTIWDPQPPSAIVPDVQLIARRNAQIAGDFPELDSRLTSLQHSAVAVEVGGLRADLHAQRCAEDSRRDAKQSQKVEDYYGEGGILKILRLCNLGSADELPAENVFRKWAAAKKNMHLAILQDALDLEKTRMQETGLQFIADPALLQTLLTLNLCMTNSNAVTTGLQPFRLPEHDDEGEAANRQYIFSLIQGSEGAAPSLSDVTKLSRAAAAAPILLMHARQQIQRLEVVVSVLLGSHHPLVFALSAYLARFNAMESKLQLLLSTTEPILPTLLVKRIAMKLSAWFEQQMRCSQAFPVPDFTDTLTAIANEDPWSPATPPGFLRALQLETLHGAGRGAVAPPPAVRRPVAPPAALAAPLRPPPAGEPLPFNNTQFNVRFQPYQASATTCRDLRDKIGTGPGQLQALPLSRIDQLPMCLAFHAKGVCNPRCGRIADHVPYTNAQYDPLFKWCEECFTV